MDLYQLRYFMAVAETGSFTKAAARAFVTQPTLSTGIRKLEDELGSPLFERDRRRVRLTGAGGRLLPRARSILQECAAVPAEVQARPVRAPLRIGFLRSLSGAALTLMLRDFSSAHPDVRLTLAEESAVALANDLSAGAVDVTISLLPDGPLPPRAVELFREPYLIALARDHALARKPRLRIEELADMPFILRTHCEALSEAQGAFKSFGVQPKVVFRTDNDERAMAMVAAGLGACHAPQSLIGAGTAGLELAEFPRTRRLGLRWREGLGEPLALFRSFAESHDWLVKGTSDLAWAR